MVIMGGKSSEHEISILSGQQVVTNLDQDKYEILPVVISKTGQWQLTSKEEIINLLNPINLKGTNKDISLTTIKKISDTSLVTDKKVDVVFIAMHGKYGEDGTIQGMLDLAGVKYTGSGVLASSIAMNKTMFRKLMVSENLPIPKFIQINKNYDIKEIAKKLGKFPYFIKPVGGGSSVGASIANNLFELKKSLDLALKYDKDVLVDEYIKGQEVTCAIIDDKKLIALPVIEIKSFKGKFFDYESKYKESGSEEIVPAKISKNLTKKIQDLSIQVFEVLGCSDFGRVDFILKDNREPIILEINTIPGLTRMSLLPKAAKAAGISYSKLLDIIINNAIKKN